jgi:hypothetical protein
LLNIDYNKDNIENNDSIKKEKKKGFSGNFLEDNFIIVT